VKNHLLKPTLLILIGLMLVITLAGACAKPATEPTAASKLTPAVAQTIKMKLGTSWPITHPVVSVTKRWIEKIQNETNGRVQITLYPSGTLLDQFAAYDQLRSGVAEIAEFSSAFPGTPLLISNALPAFIYGIDMAGARQVFNNLWNQFPELRAEYTKVKPLFNYGSPEEYVITTQKPIRTLADFKGMQLQPIPGFPELLGKLGATGSNIPMSETYNALDKNIINGTIAAAEALATSNFDEVTKYSTNLHLPTPPIIFYAMNLDTWNSLPPDIQKIIEDSSTWWETEADNALQNQQQLAIDSAKAKGHEFIELSPADLTKFYDVMQDIAMAKAADLDSRGLPGTKIFQETRRLIDEYNQAK
jgi:TRAP-type transport system periplasmic protein